MAALERTKFVSFTLPSNPSFCNNKTLWPTNTSQSIRSLHTSSNQKIRRPTATLSPSSCQAKADRNTAVRAEGHKRALANNCDKSDDDLPPFEQLFWTAPPPKTSIKASKAERALQNLKQPALGVARTQVDQTKPASGDYQGDTPDQPMTLDDDDSDEAKGAISDISTRRVERDASPHITLVTSEFALGPVKSIDASGPGYNAKDGCYIDEPALRLESCDQQGMPSAPTQDQTQILPQSSTPVQDHINQQDIDGGTPSMLVESALHSLLKPSDHGNDGWTDDSMAELEKELGLALEEQVKPSSASASAPTSSSPRSVEAPQDEIQSRERSETTGSRPEGPRDAIRHGHSAQGLQEWEQQQARVVLETQGRRELGEEELVGEGGEERRHQDTNEKISNEIPHSEDSDRSHEANDEDDEDDEDSRPAKRQKLRPTLTHNALTPPDEPTPVDNNHHHTRRTSRSPSITVESAPVAEYQEWPFQGFLKRIKIGNETTYNLEFQLSHVPEYFHLPVLSEALGMCCNKETSAEAATPHNIVAHSKLQPATLHSKRKRVPWKPEENETILKMKEDGCSWEKIHAALPHRTPGAIQVQYSTKLKK